MDKRWEEIKAGWLNRIVFRIEGEMGEEIGKLRGRKGDKI